MGLSRTIAAAALALILPSVAAAQQSPTFEFMGLDTETVAAPNALDAFQCRDEERPGEVSCTKFGTRLGDANAEILIVATYQGKLYGVSGSSIRHEYLDLLRAFTAKYGSPDRTETREWQSRSGATFDNDVAIWEFAGGELELRSMGTRTTDLLFIFIHGENSPPAEEPEVNF